MDCICSLLFIEYHNLSRTLDKISDSNFNDLTIEISVRCHTLQIGQHLCFDGIGIPVTSLDCRNTDHDFLNPMLTHFLFRLDTFSMFCPHPHSLCHENALHTCLPKCQMHKKSRSHNMNPIKHT